MQHQNLPLGPFRKADNNPVLQKNTEQGGIVTGTGHNSITDFSGWKKNAMCVSWPNIKDRQ